ncbi:MAG: hypothetical protein ACOYMA_17525 [Bacteroidia bacterium]
MTYSTSTLGQALDSLQTTYEATQGDILLFLVGVVGFGLIIGISYAAMNKGKRAAIGAVGGGKRRR